MSTYKRPEMTEEEEAIFFRRVMEEVLLKEKAERMTDGELSLALINEAWAHVDLWTPAGVFIDEAITRLRRYDIQRRWDERKARRLEAQGCFFCGAKEGDGHWSTCPAAPDNATADDDPDKDDPLGNAAWE